VSLSPRERRWLIGGGVLYAAVVIPIGIRKGGDLIAELGQSERFLHGAALYTHIDTFTGVPWPPASALLLVPFALVARHSAPLAKAAWVICNVAAIGWMLVRARGWGWRRTGLALAAVANPLQSNFEHLNVNIVIAALLVAAAADLHEGRETRAGTWVGLAAAVKAYPALLLGYFAYRRQWRALTAGVGLAAALTLVALLRYGPAGGLDSARDWLSLTTAHRWTTQSLWGFTALLGAPPASSFALGPAGLLAGAWVFRGSFSSDRPFYEVGIVATLAVLLSPITHLHYFVLLFPAWIAALSLPPPAGNVILWRAALVVAGILTSGVLHFGLYPPFLTVIETSNYTWGALLLVGLLLTRRPVEGASARLLIERDDVKAGK